jgi:hypothetical protein
MKRTVAALAFVATTCGAASAARDAQGAIPIDVEVGPRIGVGTDPSVGIVDPIGFGFGVRGGVIFRNIYLGGTVTYYFVNHTNNGSTLTATNALQVGAEAGYGVTFSILTIRPQLGVGNISFNDSVETATPDHGAQSNSDTIGYFYLEPGVVGLVSFGLFYVGADVNLLILPNTGAEHVQYLSSQGPVISQGNGSAASLTAHAQVGVRF